MLKLKIFLFILTFCFFCFSVYPHPLDVTLTHIQIEENGLWGTTYVHPFEVALLIEKNKFDIDNVSLNQLELLLLRYFRNHFQVWSHDEPIAISNIIIEHTEVMDILSSGVYFNYNVSLYEDIYPLIFKVDLFTEYFKIQTNKLILLDEGGNLYPGSHEVILTAQNKEWVFDRNNPDFSLYKDDFTDMDNDGLTDKFENFYALDPTNADMDNDGYSDSMEFAKGSDPFDAESTPEHMDELSNYLDVNDTLDVSQAGDTYSDETVLRIEIPLNQESPEIDEQQIDKKSTRNIIKEYSTLNKYTKVNIPFFPDKNDLKETLSDFNLGSFLLLLITIFAAGFLYAALDVNGKGILIAYLAYKKKRLQDALYYIFTFTVINMLSLLLLIVVFLFLKLVIDINLIITITRVISGSGLLVISILLVIKGIKDLQGKIPKISGIKSGYTKDTAAIAILAGIAPCLAEWVIFEMLYEIEHLGMLFFILPLFTLGIFVFLTLTSIIIFIVRYVMFDIFNKVVKYSLLISGGLMFIFALLFFIPGVVF